MRLSTRPALVRLAHIDREIRAGHWPNASTLSRLLEVTPRTIQRDIDCFRDQLGAPIEYDRKRHGYFFTDPTYPIPFSKITEGEFLALFLAERLIQQYQGLPCCADLARLFQKIAAFLPPEKVTFNLEHLAQAYFVRQAAVDPCDADRFRHLVRAVEESRQLELVYWSAWRDDTTRRRVDPYHLMAIDGDWYLIGYCHLREEVRMFSPGRIRALAETGERFDRPADFRAGDYLDVGFRKIRGTGPPQTVLLRFSPIAARYVREKTWHPSQKWAEVPDGGLILSLQVNHLAEVKRWALSFGSDCEVLEPMALKEEIHQELKAMLGVYSVAPANGQQCF
jgi:proteasome accessory factor B